MDQFLQSVDCAGEVVAVLRQGVEGGLEVLDQLLDDLVVVRERVRERRRLRAQRIQGSPLALQDLDQRGGKCVDVLWIQSLDNGSQPAEQQIEVQGRRRTILRNL